MRARVVNQRPMIGVGYAGCGAGTGEPHERSEDVAKRRFATLAKGIAMTALVSLAAGTPALAGTFVYVTNAEDGDIATYGMKPDGELQPGARAKAASVVMPMAVSPDRRFLYAASRSRPYSVHVYAIDSATGALRHLATSPLAESFPYISLDRTGRFLFGASYAAHLISVNAVGSDGRVAAEPLQVISVAATPIRSASTRPTSLSTLPRWVPTRCSSSRSMRSRGISPRTRPRPSR
jgi:hypothetical protein